jgi:hypothetical protein
MGMEEGEAHEKMVSQSAVTHGPEKLKTACLIPSPENNSFINVVPRHFHHVVTADVEWSRKHWVV